MRERAAEPHSPQVRKTQLQWRIHIQEFRIVCKKALGHGSEVSVEDEIAAKKKWSEAVHYDYVNNKSRLE